MTDYGRGPGSESWHPEDPLFGDRYGAQQPSPDGWDPYADARRSQEPQYPYQDQSQYQSQHQQQYQQQYEQQYPSQQPQPHQPQQHYGGWNASPGDPAAAYSAGPGDPYPDPYGGQQQPDPYGQNGYPPPVQPPYQSQPHEEPAHTGEWQAVPEPEEPEQEEPAPASSAGGQDDDAAAEEEQLPGRREQRLRSKKRRGGSKRRSGLACLVVLAILGGGVAGVGYVGYQLYDSHFGAPEDFAGEGTGEVQVEIPAGATLTVMGNILKQQGVVKSVESFTAAATANPEGTSIQPGVYVLRKEMSAAAAVDMMLDPAAQNVLIVPEGQRAAEIYEAIDKKLGVEAGTTAEVAASHDFDLPDYADDNDKIKNPLEGFLYPARYSVGKGMKPEALLQEMIDEAEKQHKKYDLQGTAEEFGLESPLQVITVASLVQAEGKTHDDFRKMARVVYNRLEPDQDVTNGMLEFDSTYNYLKNQSEINLSLTELRNYDDPYNTYFYKGLPPGPIGNPGADALKAAEDPEPGDWYFFVSVDGDKTQFTETLEEHDRLAEEFRRKQEENG